MSDTSHDDAVLNRLPGAADDRAAAMLSRLSQTRSELQHMSAGRRADEARSLPPPVRPPETDGDGLVAAADEVIAEQFAYGTVAPSSFGWGVFGRIVIQLVQIGGTVVLGRLIAPSQFGIFAAALVIFTLGQIFTDLGLGPAIVHRQRLDRSFLTTAFWLNALSGIVLTLLTVAIAYPMSLWYGYHQLTWVVPLLGLTFTVSISTVGLALMERRFRFRALLVVEFISVVAGQLTAIAIAVLHPSVFALAVAPALTATIMSVVVLATCGWRPPMRIRLDRADLRELRNYAGFVSFFNLLNYGARNSDDFFLGRYATAQGLGFYARSYQLMLLPISQVVGGLSRVLQPSFAQAKHDRDELQRLHTLAEVGASALGFPFCAIIFALAPSGIPFVLGNQWDPMVHLLQIFALSIPGQMLSAVNGSLYMATGHVRRFFFSGAVNSVVLIVAFAIAAPHGTTVVAIVFTVQSVVGLPVAVLPICSALNISIRPVLPRLVVTAAFGGIIFAIVYFIPSLLGAHEASGTRLGVQTGLVVMAAATVAVIVRRLGLARVVSAFQGPRLGLHRR